MTGDNHTSTTRGAMDEKGKEQKYSVGYKKPPQQTQFKPGQSGSPKGRPKKVSTINEVFGKELRSLVSITTTNGRSRKISKLQAIAKQFSNKAASGDHKAAKFVLDQVNTGKPDSGDSLANLIQEFRLVNSRHEAADSEQHALAKVKAKETT
jgi:hypothetical protein